MRTSNYSAAAAIFLLLITAISLGGLAAPNPLPPGVYRGINTSAYNYGEIHLVIGLDGSCHLIFADGKRVSNGDLDLHKLIRSPQAIEAKDWATERHIRRSYAAFRPEGEEAPLFLIRHYLLVDSPVEDKRYSLKQLSAPAVLIFPNGKFDEGDDHVKLYSPQQDSANLFDLAVAGHEKVTGAAVPRITTGGRSFQSCLDAFSIIGRRPN